MATKLLPREIIIGQPLVFVVFGYVEGSAGKILAKIGVGGLGRGMIIGKGWLDALRGLGFKIRIADTTHMDGAPIRPVEDLPECNFSPTFAPPDGSGE